MKAPIAAGLNANIRQLPDVCFSKTNKCWLVPLTKQHYLEVYNKLKPVASELKTEEMKQYFQQNKLPANVSRSTQTEQAAVFKNRVEANRSDKVKLCEANEGALKQLVQILQLKAYSASTIRTYTSEFSVFLTLLGNTTAESLTVKRIKDYLQYCLVELKLSENTLHSRINALKFYYEQVLKKEKFFWEIPRPKKPLILPKLLNEEELRRLFNALSNKKHKAMLFTAYSAGLRVSEVVGLKIKDIDSKRMQLFIEKAKGKKDRYVNLSPVLLDILRQYIKDYKPRPQFYLFESEQTGTAYPTRTLQQIFNNAKSKAGIKKEVGIHSLRHSFATHLLDKGTDIRYIKELLGHFDIKTTERYLHVSKQQLVNIISPLDDLWKKEQIDW